MQQLSVGDFPGLKLGDKRRNERMVTIINNVSLRPGSSIPQQNNNWSETKATYTFFSDKDIKVSALEKAVQIQGTNQLKEIKEVLVVHDITYFSYNDFPCEDLGYLTQEDGQGIIGINTIAVSTQGWPLALLRQHLWTRLPEDYGKRKKRKEKLFEQKESYEWYKSIKEANQCLGTEVEKIHICDCEGDDYELFFFAYEPNTKVLIRAAQNRKLKGEQALLWDHVAALDPVAIVELSIPDPKGHKRVPIQAEVRYQQVEIQRPKRSKSPYDTVSLWAIEVRQKDEKLEWQKEAIDWKLLTNIDIQGEQEVLQCVRWYSFRWLIERFHYVLKSGTKIEELRLEKGTALEKAIHVYSLAAMQVMKALYLSRETPEVSCEVVFTRTQWVVLYILFHKTTELPQEPPTLQEAVRWTAMLGGHLGRKSDGPPGMKTFWQGYQRIMDAACVFDTITHQKFG
jgi:PIN domain nuclease of toxin-antitoxin system